MPDRPTLIIDGHLDLAFNALHHRRDLTQDIHVLREREDPKPPGPSHPDSLRDRKRPESFRAALPPYPCRKCAKAASASRSQPLCAECRCPPASSTTA